MKRSELPLTHDQLQQAWQHRTRPGWPGTLEATLSHPVWGVALRGLARQLCRESLRRAARPLAVPRHKHAPFDARRAAANDFDKD